MVSSAAAREMLHLVKFSKWFKLFVCCFSPDCHLWKKFLSLSSRCLFPSHEEHHQVGFHYMNIHSI